jgi:GntR family transcriptional regulator
MPAKPVKGYCHHPLKKPLDTEGVLLYQHTRTLEQQVLGIWELSMTQAWRDDQPIWRQIKDRVLSAILDGGIKEGEPLPSVRQVALDLQVNPLTVSKAYQELADDGLVERRRGLGMFVIDGARKGLSASERNTFLKEEWPVVVTRIKRLGLSAQELLKDIEGNGQ